MEYLNAIDNVMGFFAGCIIGVCLGEVLIKIYDKFRR